MVFVSFLQRILHSEPQSWAQMLRQTYLRGVSGEGSVVGHEGKKSDAPITISPKEKDPSRLNLENLEPCTSPILSSASEFSVEFARQLTLYDLELYRRVDSRSVLYPNTLQKSFQILTEHSSKVSARSFSVFS